MTFDRYSSLGYRINLLAKRFQRALERRLSVHGVAPGSFKILVILWEEDGLSQTEIARRLEIEQPTVANTVRRMIRDRLVTMDADPEDARRVSVRLTPAARAVLPTLLAEADALNRQAATALEGEDPVVFLSRLERMARVLDQND